MCWPVVSTHSYDTVVLLGTHPTHPSQTHRHAVLGEEYQLGPHLPLYLPPGVVHGVEVEAGDEERHVPVAGVGVCPGVGALLPLAEAVQQRLPFALSTHCTAVAILCVSLLLSI